MDLALVRVRLTESIKAIENDIVRRKCDKIKKNYSFLVKENHDLLKIVIAGRR